MGSAAVQTQGDEMQILIGDIVAQTGERRDLARTGHCCVRGTYLARYSAVCGLAPPAHSRAATGYNRDPESLSPR